MTERFPPIRLEKVKTQSLSTRSSKVHRTDFARPWKGGERFTDFLESLPRILAGRKIREVIDAVARAHLDRRTVMVAMGAHVIKVGLNPVIIDLMERGVITCVAMNGAGMIHDAELALVGHTSEEVSEGLATGAFGMAAETAVFLGQAIRKAGEQGRGLGETVGAAINAALLPYAHESILAAGSRMEVPVTVHVALGTDTLHMHPHFDPMAAGGATHHDFRVFASVVTSLEQGVFLNAGSAVILPEVFLKALTLVRNLGHRVACFTSVNMDFLRHYRPTENVVNRPTALGGKGIHLTGHHEIMLPLLAGGVIEAIEKRLAPCRLAEPSSAHPTDT